MPQYYDITLKSILKELPRKFMKILTGFDTAKFLDVQFPDIRYRQPDLLVELPDDTLFHMEMQAQNDGNMDCRELEYYHLIFCEFRKSVTQVVLYVGSEKLKMNNEIKAKGLHFTYKIIDIRNIDCRELLESDDPGDNILAILCKTEDADGTIKGILAKLYELPPDEREDYILKLLTLSRLRGLTKSVKREVKKMPVTIDITKDELYLDGVEVGLLNGKREGKLEGLLEGERKGLLEGKRDGLLEGIELGLELKYGLAGLELMKIVKGINTIDKLEAFKNLIKKADSVDELKEFLTKSA
ncbi:MAG: Yae1 family protein [Nitrospirae bacterium YQR-1]